MGAYEAKALGTEIVRTGIFIATETRLVFFAKKTFGFELESFPYSRISSIAMSKGFGGYSISFFSSGNKVSMKWIDQNVSEFVGFVRKNIV